MENKNKTKKMGKKSKTKKDAVDTIQMLTDKLVMELLRCTPKLAEKDVFYMKLSQIKLGMTYLRDREMMKRISSGHMIRIINFITTSPKERLEYVRASIPEFTVTKQVDDTKITATGQIEEK